MSIHLLAPDVAAKIAAGEVVERPANAAKELVENSLDAGATEIRVEIRQGGQRQLRVVDNGHGILAEEVPLAFQRHATSKLSTAEDLNHIATLGFRGEALFSISAVSHVTLTTRHHTAEFGTQLRMEGGELIDQSGAGAAVGTVISVEHLFYNVPARKKFLRRPATEAGQISTVVQRYALAYPDRRFSFVNDGRLIFQSTGSGDLFDVLVKVYGLENAKQMVPVGAQKPAVTDAVSTPDLTGGLDSEVDFMGESEAAARADDSYRDNPDTVLVTGYASLPTLTRSNRRNIDLFVNQRYVEDRSLTYAVVQAYHTLLPVGRSPLAVIFLATDPAQVDVNVHPQKTQVRFLEERRMFSAVQKAVRQAVIQHAPVPGARLSAQPDLTGQENIADDWTAQSGWAERRTHILQAGQQHKFHLEVPPSVSTAGNDTALEGQSWDHSAADDDSLPDDPALRDQQRPAADASPPVTEAEETTTLAGDPKQLPPLRVVGQVGAMYIIAEGPEGLFLIDQHAAHERILYEKFMVQRHQTDNGEVARQNLLEPLTLHVGHEVTGLVAQHLTELQLAGFEIEPFGGDTFLVRAVPGVLSDQDPLRLLEEIVAAMASQRNLVGEELEARLVKMVCKRAAIKAGQLLSVIEMQELVRQLEECRSPRTCPHGRPTMIQLSAGELEKAFGRI